MADLQRIVDALGQRLQRAVAIDNPALHLQAHCPHTGPIDEARLSSLLYRRPPERAIAWALSFGITEATEPRRLPANPEIGTIARLCVPIRSHGLLLGYLWLFDTDPPLRDDEIRLAEAAAEAAADVMYRDRLLESYEAGRTRELLRDLLSERGDVRRQAADELTGENLVVAGASVTAMVVRPAPPEAGSPAPSLRSDLETALDEMRRAVSLRHSLCLARPDHGLFVALGEGGSPPPDVPVLAERLLRTVAGALGGVSGRRIVVGIGEAQPELVQTAESYQQALLAARTAQLVPSFAPIVRWSQLGIYRMLARLTIEQIGAEVLPPGLRRLFADRRHDALVDTLEAYLDRAGDARATAAELALHRGTLYYRLQRIEQVAGVNLQHGEDRLALHLGLKLARLAGLYPARAVPR